MADDVGHGGNTFMRREGQFIHIGYGPLGIANQIHNQRQNMLGHKVFF